MDKHQRAIEAIARDLIRFDPVCSIIVSGSVGRDEHHADSDIDLFVCTWRYNETSTKGIPKIPDAIEWSDLSRHRFTEDEDGDPLWFVDDIEIQVHFSSPLKWQATYMAWKTTCGNNKELIVYDPSGILKWGARTIVTFAKDNPEIHKICTANHSEYHLWKKNPEHPRRYERIQDFWASLDSMDATVSFKSFVEERMGDIKSSHG